MEKFKNKYAIKSSRLEGYDYSQNGLYFVTICTKDREELFGEIVNEKIILNDVGKVVQEEWLKTPIIRKDVFLDAWVIMPNHVHVIVGPMPQRTLPEILHSWKSYTAKFANKRLGRSGTFWQAEYYDHVIRNAEEFAHGVRYIRENPAKAGLRDWPWVWVRGEEKT